MNEKLPAWLTWGCRGRWGSGPQPGKLTSPGHVLRKSPALSTLLESLSLWDTLWDPGTSAMIDHLGAPYTSWTDIPLVLFGCGLGSREVCILPCGQPWLLWSAVVAVDTCGYQPEQRVRGRGALLVWGHQFAFSHSGDFPETQSRQEP